MDYLATIFNSWNRPALAFLTTFSGNIMPANDFYVKNLFAKGHTVSIVYIYIYRTPFSFQNQLYCCS